MLPDEINAPEVRAELDRLLSSQVFAKSRRASRLLRFVVEKTIAGTARSLNEYAIGLEVFDRNAADYNPGDDPIVRVQVGRLREKLHHYYSSGADSSNIRFEIPVGTYVPIFRRANPKIERLQTGKLMILSIKGITTDEAAAQFALGLREELVHHLFQAFGDIVVPPAGGDGPLLADAAEEQGIGYALEGSATSTSIARGSTCTAKEAYGGGRSSAGTSG
jgi:hypothetical protein